MALTLGLRVGISRSDNTMCPNLAKKKHFLEPPTPWGVEDGGEMQMADLPDVKSPPQPNSKTDFSWS